MPPDLNTWKLLYNVFDPTRRLEESDQSLYVSRPGAVAEDIATDLRLGLTREEQEKWVVCGSMGSGKSTELVHLGSLLRDSHVVIGLDLPNTIAQIDLIEPPEVLFLIGAAAVRTAEEVFDHEVPKKLQEELVAAFRGLLPEGHGMDLGKVLQWVALFAANLASPGVGAVASAAKGAADMATGALGDKSRITVGRSSGLGGKTRPVKENEADLERLREAVDDILDDLRAIRPPVILVDGLDKLQDMAAIRNLFTIHRILALPKAEIIYTGPITLMLETEWAAAGAAFSRVRLTNVVLNMPELDQISIEESKLLEGRETLTNVVRRRLDLLGLSVPDVFEEGALEKLIEKSGGLLRDLMQLISRAVRGALRRSEMYIGTSRAEETIIELRKEYQITLTTRRVDELLHVRKWGKPSGGDESGRLLIGGYILPYTNGDVWFEPHPILRDRLDP